MSIIKIKGYVITPPTFPWQHRERNSIIGETSYNTFARSKQEAWMKYLKITIDEWDSLKVDELINKGYVLKNATMIIND